jgi:hypothetical protein
MSQDSFNIPDQAGASFLAALNVSLQALASKNSGATSPDSNGKTTYGYQWWADTTSGNLKIRNGANNAWVTIGPLDTANFGMLLLSGGTMTGALTMSGAAINEAQGNDIASSATINLDTATGNLVDVTGTTTITAVTLSQGRERTVRFTGALTLTNGASLVLPGGANITTAAGDFAIFRGYGSGVVRCVSYIKANGQAVVSSSSPLPNFVINPELSIAIAGLPTSNADDTYAHDCWYVLTQTSTIAVTQLTDVENTTPFMARLTQSQASAQRMGYATIIESKDCKHLRGQTVNLSMRYRCSSSQAIRFAILEWTGTADAVTSDVVNTWTSGTYTAGNFFLASNLTITSVSANTPSAATLTDFTVSATLGSSMNNLIIFVWTEGTAAQNVTLDIGKVKLEKNSSATAFVAPDWNTELLKCKRYYNQTFEYGTVPAQNAGRAGCLEGCGIGGGGVTTYMWQLEVPMFSAPTITTYNPNNTNANVRDFTGSSDVAVSVDPNTAKSTRKVSIGAAVSGQAQSGVHATASARL